MAKPPVRRQDLYVALTKDAFRERFFARFYDPAFEAVAAELEKVFATAWDGYIKYRKSPRVAPAGPGFGVLSPPTGGRFGGSEHAATTASGARATVKRNANANLEAMI